jgi:hypothetical protein
MAMQIVHRVGLADDFYFLVALGVKSPWTEVAVLRNDI